MEDCQWTDYIRVAFTVISPLCQDIIKCPKEENVLKLKCFINQISPEAVQLYQRYICIPLCISLVKKDVRLEIKCRVADCLTKTISRTKVRELDLFMRIFSDIFRLVSDTSLQNVDPDVPEELKLSVMRCATVLISNSSDKVLYEFYSEQYVPVISLGIHYCLSIINRELFLDLRLAALKCLLHVCQVHNEIHSTSLELRIKVGNILMRCLPGIIFNLRKAISVDEKQNHKITMLAIKAWSRITAVVMEDMENAKANNNDWAAAQLDLFAFIENLKQGKAKQNSKESMLDELKGKKRTKEWYTHASRSMFPIVDDICHLYFFNWKVRQEMISSAELLLLTCSRNMKECAPSFVELLLILSEDELTDTSERSRLALSKFSEQFEKSDTLPLVEIMEDRFLKAMNKLCTSPQGEEDLKLCLNLMCGYLRLLGSHLKRVVKSSVHLNTISSALIRTITLDYFVVSPLEDWSLGTSDADILKTNIPWKCFKHFKDKFIFMKFKDICQLLSQYSDLSTISDHFLYHFHQEPESQKEIILIINEIFSNGLSSDFEVLVPIIKRIVSSYLDPIVWEVLKIGESERSKIVKNPTIEDIRSRTVQACLLVEGLGVLSYVATSKTVESSSIDTWFFRTCLYPILERIGHPNPMLSGAGKLALVHISHAIGMSIPMVIQNNCDFVIHHVVLKLQHATGLSSPAPLHVLVAILEFATPGILVNLEEAVTSVVNYGFKYMNDQKTLDCLKCMYVFTKFVKEEFAKQKELGIKKQICVGSSGMHENDTKNTSNNNKTGIVTQRILDFQRTRKIGNGYLNYKQDLDEETQDTEENCKYDTGMENNEDFDMEDSKPPLPKHVDLTIVVLKQCLTFISSKEQERKLMAMDIISEGIWVIQDYIDELLPLVHKIWGPLSVQFNDDDPLVMNRAFHLLSVIAVVAKDFIRDRTLKKVLPPISKFLLNQAKISLKKDLGSTYRFSQAYKLQLSLLLGLGELAFHLDFQEQDLSELLTATAPYLSNLQPQPLQDACIRTYKLASKINPDIVWLKLAYLGNIFQNFKPPSEEFKVYQVPNQSQFGKEFKKNVSILLQLIK